MTAVGSEISASHDSTNRQTRHARVLDLFRDPLRTFVVLAVLAGGYLVFAVPYFGGVDETAHFYRSYQISTGHLVPEHADRAGFSGACIPVDVVVQVERDKFVYLRHLLDLAGSKAAAPKPPSRSEVPRCPHDQSEGLVTFSTFGSPVPYVPQVAAILVTRSLGVSVNGMLLAGRLAMLTGYIVVVALAIRRSPRAKWALCATALLPVALFQSGASVSHDTMTTAVALFVLSSALRTVDPPDGVTPRQLLMEALLASTVLGLCKPAYVVVAFCYLLPLLGPRRRPELRLLALAPLLGVVVSLGWNQIVGDLWKTDAGYFGVRADPSHQKHELITAPWHFAGDALRTVFEQVTDWAQSLVEVGPSVTHWPWGLAVVMLLVFVGASAGAIGAGRDCCPSVDGASAALAPRRAGDRCRHDHRCAIRVLDRPRVQHGGRSASTLLHAAHRVASCGDRARQLREASTERDASLSRSRSCRHWSCSWFRPPSACTDPWINHASVASSWSSCSARSRCAWAT